ncbi:RNA polymerase sigma factor RpoE [Simiduia aestuariiviva]|uniref:RNA polymerase sigma-70 factor (ECF subfamily) n=1 Tax=Simiduia aestuariiviva TaxID=1510459 RepID=A0A839UNE0_9GAMM|nr:RNA polymerase sigma factor RpoE [Simiduia aestuariiviva]MBB3168261.1 RNA polymerase sigma-70 factor (ECF subfamily) [Simiduia aestuariiviva]
MAQAPDNDQMLVARVQKGDKRAFDLLVLKYQHKVAAIVSRYIRDTFEVNDVVQEAFIKAYRALPGFRGESAFYTWLFRIAVNTAKNHLVSRSRRPPAQGVDAEDAEFLAAEYMEDVNTPEGLHFRDELDAIVSKTVASLPEDLRSAVTLREIDGKSYEEIAEIMQCPVGTVRSRIFRAREVLDSKIKAYMQPQASKSTPA